MIRGMSRGRPLGSRFRGNGGQNSEGSMLTHTLNISKQIKRLQDLEYGWLSGDEPALDKDGLAWLENALKSKIAFTSQTFPHLYPTETGGVQAEWRLGDISADLEIDLDTRQAIWGWSNLASKDYGERELDLNSEDAWQWLAQELNRMAASASR